MSSWEQEEWTGKAVAAIEENKKLKAENELLRGQLTFLEVTKKSLYEQNEKLMAAARVLVDALEEIGHDQNMLGEKNDTANYFYQLANGALDKYREDAGG